MKKVSRDRGPRASAVADGFSLLEVLIALSLLATIAITTFSLTAGALHLSRRSAISRQVTRLAASRLEEISRLPYDRPFLTIHGGAYEVVHRERWWPSESRWLGEGAVAPEGQTSFRSEIRVWAFDASAIEAGETYLESGERLSGAAPRLSRHLKEIRIRVWLDSAPEPGGGRFPRATLRWVRRLRRCRARLSRTMPCEAECRVFGRWLPADVPLGRFRT